MKITSPLISAVFEAIYNSVDDLKSKISDVKYGQIEDGKETILFNLDGHAYKGIMTGRNRNLCLGFGIEQDKAIAARVLLDNCAEKIEA